MKKNEARDLLESFGILQVQAEIFKNNKDICNSNARKAAVMYEVLKNCISILPAEEQDIIRSIYIEKQNLKAYAREIG